VTLVPVLVVNLRCHVSEVTSTCFFCLGRLRKIVRVLNVEARQLLVCVLVLSPIDYCNAILAGLHDSTVAALQRVMNAAAHFVASQ
jgi:hypothetical protein